MYIKRKFFNLIFYVYERRGVVQRLDFKLINEKSSKKKKTKNRVHLIIKFFKCKYSGWIRYLN